MSNVTPQPQPEKRFVGNEATVAAFEAAPVVAHLQNDCFCHGCGYNLYSLAVRKEPATGVFMARCPECGQFCAAGEIAAAGQTRINRLLGVLGYFWAVVCVGAVIAEMAIQIGIQVGLSEEIGRFIRDHESTSSSKYYGGNVEELLLQIAVLLIVSISLSWFMIVSVCVLSPHWSRLGYFGFVLFRAGMVLLVSFLAITQSSYYYPTQHGGIIAISFFVTCIVGIIGVFAGRPFARLMFTIILPRHRRASMAYLWTVDGLAPPKAEPGPRS